MIKTMNLKMTGYYPCSWDDLIDKNMKVKVSVYTLQSAKKDSLLKLKKEGVYYDKKDKIYNIVLDVPQLTEEIVKNIIKELSKIAGVKYQLGKSDKRYVGIDI